MPKVLIGIGSNIDPETHIPNAVARLREKWPDIEFSHVYKCAAQEFEDQDDFYNAVAVINTDESAYDIHTFLEGIEKEEQKNPPFRYGPRTIDFDILLYGDQTIQQEDMSVPHPRMHRRRFVLDPMHDVWDMNETHPISGRPWQDLFQDTLDQACERIDMTL